MAGTDESIFLSVVIPAYNEEARLGDTLRTVRTYLESRIDAPGAGKGTPFFSGGTLSGITNAAEAPTPRCGLSEIIVVDDGSTDRTAEVAAEALRGRPNDRILGRSENRGKGFSVREGILAAAGQLILFSDADLSTPIDEFEKLLAGLAEGNDLVIGSRALPDSDVRRRQNKVREGMGRMYNLLVRLLLMKGIRDTQCGFKLFRRKAAFDIFSRLRTEGFGFDVEVLYLARRLGYTIGQVPVVWINSPQSKVRMFRSSAGMILDLLRVRRFHRKVIPHGKA
jgi:dolichyl-phosphate beta-glucosyltransferase